MTTSIMIHNCTKISAGTVSKSNANAITLTIQSHDVDYDITMFDLPDETAERIAATFGLHCNHLSEEEIRKDERRKIASRLGVEA